MSNDSFRADLLNRIGNTYLEEPDTASDNLAGALATYWERVLRVEPNEYGWHPGAMSKTETSLARIRNAVLDQLKPRPIATAPRDGTMILLICPSGYSSTKQRYTSGYWVRGEDGWRDYAGDQVIDGGEAPTHWMPLDLVTPTEGVS